MTAVTLVTPKFQFSDSEGVPLAGGTVDMYLAGTTTRTTTWQDRGQAVANTNPIILDSDGSCSIRIDPALAYKMVVSDSEGVVQSHLGGDNIVGLGADESLAELGAIALANFQSYYNRLVAGEY
jgi:hypothetical protein